MEISNWVHLWQVRVFKRVRELLFVGSSMYYVLCTILALLQAHVANLGSFEVDEEEGKEVGPFKLWGICLM